MVLAIKNIDKRASTSQKLFVVVFLKMCFSLQLNPPPWLFHHDFKNIVSGRAAVQNVGKK